MYNETREAIHQLSKLCLDHTNSIMFNYLHLLCNSTKNSHLEQITYNFETTFGNIYCNRD